MRSGRLVTRLERAAADEEDDEEHGLGAGRDERREAPRDRRKVEAVLAVERLLPVVALLSVVLAAEGNAVLRSSSGAARPHVGRVGRASATPDDRARERAAEGALGAEVPLESEGAARGVRAFHGRLAVEPRSAARRG